MSKKRKAIRLLKSHDVAPAGCFGGLGVGIFAVEGREEGIVAKIFGHPSLNALSDGVVGIGLVEVLELLLSQIDLSLEFQQFVLQLQDHSLRHGFLTSAIVRKGSLVLRLTLEIFGFFVAA